MLEAVSRAAANDPYIRIVRMPIDDEVVVGGIFVLADTRLEQRRIFHPRETVREIAAGRGETFIAYLSLA